MIRNNLFYKLLALGVAVALWGYVNAERNPQAQKSITVAIESRGAPRGYATEIETPVVTLELRGPKTTIDAVRREDASAWVDLGKLKPGRGLVDQQAKVEFAVAGVGEDDLSVSLSRRYVRARIESIRGKRLPVEVRFLSPPPAGYSYSDPEITPDSVEIRGRSTQVARVQKVILPLSSAVTSGAPARGINGLFMVIAADASGNAVEGVELDKDKVRLSLGVIEAPATKTVIISENIRGRARFPAKVVHVEVQPESVTLEGRAKTLAAISTVETDEVSIEGMHETFTREVALRIPPGMRAVNARKARVTVTIGAGE